MLLEESVPVFLRIPVGQGAEGTMISSCIRRLGSNFGFKIFVSIFLGVFRKWIFWGYEDYVDIFGGHHRFGLYLGSFLCILGYFLKVKVKTGMLLGVAKI